MTAAPRGVDPPTAVPASPAILDAALALDAAGLCVLPAAGDGSKRPAVEWRRWQRERPDVDQLRAWFADGRRTGLGIVCGAVSGGLEVTELEGRAVDAGALTTLAELAELAGEGELWRQLTLDGWLVRSPSGGVHLLYRLTDADVPGNTKLAATAEHVTLAETRGAGGWVITAPSHGTVHPSGGAWLTLAGSVDTLPTITADERSRLHTLVRQLDERPAPAPAVASPFAALSRGSDGVSPGDDYAERTSWDDLLTPAGWRRVFSRGAVDYWRRPGKAHGISATTGYGDGDWLYVFTSSTEFDPERTYTRFGAYAALHHGGDHKAAARALLDQGYGQRPVELHPVDRPAPAPRQACTLTAAHAVFARWLGDTYDLQALDAVLAAAAVEQLDGDPVWLLLVSGAGNAKTETVSALAGAGAHVTSTITSEGALLSATSKKEHAKDATGGLLRKIGDSGLLCIKDVTSILSMNNDTRAAVLAAMREVYDGRWERNVGTDGGRTLTWTGRLSLVGAVTTAYDAAHGVIAAMGDRFALVRVDSAACRLAAGRQALGNVGREVQMRAELAEAAGGVLAQLRSEAAQLTDADVDELLRLADLVTLSRTAVERDKQGNVVDAHAPEAPTRFAKMLGQLVRGGLALGMPRAEALALARRVAGDSMPPLRLVLLADLLDHAPANTSQVQKRVQKPRSTVDRALQELHVLGLVIQYEAPGTSRWLYELAEVVDPTTLRTLVTRKVSTPGVREQKKAPPLTVATDLSGDRSPFAPLSRVS